MGATMGKSGGNLLDSLPSTQVSHFVLLFLVLRKIKLLFIYYVLCLRVHFTLQCLDWIRLEKQLPCIALNWTNI